MKNLFLLAICLLAFVFANAQSRDTSRFKVIKEFPRPYFEECENATDKTIPCTTPKFLEFIYKNLKYPAAARSARIEGTVITTFLVNIDGTLSNLQIKTPLGYGCDEEALRLIKLLEEKGIDWIPGKNEVGEPISVYYTMPIRFNL